MATEVADLANPIKKHWNWAGDSYRPLSTNDFLTETIVHWPKHGFTHVDAPCHMVREGPTTDDCALSQLCGEAAVIDISDLVPGGAVTADILAVRGQQVRPGDILILRSNLYQRFPNTTPAYWTNSPYVDESGARWIVERGCQALAIDFPQDYPAREMGDRLVRNEEWVEHQIVLGGRLMHLEHLRNLDRLQKDRVFLIGWPVKIAQSDGGPSRPIALLEWPKGSPDIVDLSLTLGGGWRNVVRVGRAKGFESGDPVQETGFASLGHSHTHVVMPSYIDARLANLDALVGDNICRLVREATIVDLTDISGGIDRAALERRGGDIKNDRILVLRTGHAERCEYTSPDWLARSPHLTQDAAAWIVERKFSAIAADFELDMGRKKVGLGLACKSDIPVETSLLRAGVALIKNVTQLSKLDGRDFLIAAMPLYLPGAESAPARVLALQWRH